MAETENIHRSTTDGMVRKVTTEQMERELDRMILGNPCGPI